VFIVIFSFSVTLVRCMVAGRITLTLLLSRIAAWVPDESNRRQHDQGWWVKPPYSFTQFYPG